MNQPISPELLITQLYDENAKLKLDLAKTIDDSKDFEILAIGWKRGYDIEVKQLKVKIKHLEQTIEELENENREISKSLRNPER